MLQFIFFLHKIEITFQKPYHFLATSVCVWGVSVWSNDNIYWPSLCVVTHCPFWTCHNNHGIL